MLTSDSGDARGGINSPPVSCETFCENLDGSVAVAVRKLHC